MFVWWGNHLEGVYKENTLFTRSWGGERREEKYLNTRHSYMYRILLLSIAPSRWFLNYWSRCIKVWIILKRNLNTPVSGWCSGCGDSHRSGLDALAGNGQHHNLANSRSFLIVESWTTGPQSKPSLRNHWGFALVG